MSKPPNNQEEENLGSFYMGRMRPPQESERVLPRGLLTILALVAFGVILWYAYPRGQEKHADVDVPVIAADTSVYKFPPDDPGGMEVRHQDSTVFDPLVKKSPDGVERLLPTPEEPLDKDEALKGDAKVELAKDKPELNLDLQMEPVDEDGTEKVVTKEEAEARAKAAAAEAKEEASTEAAVKPEKKPAEKPEVKTAPKKADSAAASSSGPLPAGTYIQLGSYPGPAGAKEDWAKLQKKYPKYLKGLTMRTERVDLGKKGVWYRLYAGKVSDTQAQEICSALKTQNPGGCIVTKK